MKKRVGGPVPLSVATESVIAPNIIEAAIGRVMLVAGGVVLCYWLSTKKK